ncbi:glycosyltransferase family 4 protein [Candidatus Solincola sp.]|nr:glycosyltransferase family 1 protein [Actinomycetota bacterium]
MRVALFADQLFYRQPGGIGTYIRNLVPGLAKGLSGVELLLPYHGPPDADPFPSVEGVVMRRLPGRRDATGILWHTVGRPFLERYLGHLDLVHTPSLVYPPSRAPLVATVHDLCVVRFPGAFPAQWRLFHRRGLDLILGRARSLLVDSKATADDLRTLTGRRDPRVRVVPLGVEEPTRPGREEVEKVLAKHGLRPGYLLFVGTIEPRKNLSRLVQAYASLDPPYRDRTEGLVLVGARGWLGRWELSRVLSQDGVRWLGFLPRQELEAVFRGAFLFVYPSLYEGFGLPVLEAMARGVPVITSRTSSLREVAEGAAFLVDPEDVMDIRKALRRLIGDGELRDQLAELGRRRASEYSWNRTVGLTLEAYREVLED